MGPTRFALVELTIRGAGGDTFRDYYPLLDISALPLMAKVPLLLLESMLFKSLFNLLSVATICEI